MRTLTGILAVVLLFSVSVHPTTFSAGSASSPGFDTANIDSNCKPCDDFNQWATGGWTARTPIPGAYSEWGAFQELYVRNQENLRIILEAAAKDTSASKGSNVQKIGDFYASGMDLKQIEAAGLKPVEPFLDRINAIRDARGVQDMIAALHVQGVGSVFNFGAEQDPKNSTEVIASTAQGGLGLPDRDYYFNTDDNSKKIRVEYVKHLTEMFKLLGDDPNTAAKEAKVVMDLETKLAKVSMTQVEQRDPNAQYNKLNLRDLKKLMPGFSWETYLKTVGTPPVAEINIAQPKFFKAVGGYLKSVPLAAWKSYFRWNVVNGTAGYLPERFGERDFEFYGKTLEGKKERTERWKRVVAATDNALGEALGEAFVKKHFSAESKAKVVEILENIKATLRDRLGKLEWMGPETRKQALAKLDAIVNKIGYPDTWRDYSKLDIDRTSYLGNVLAANRFEFQRQLAKIGKPVDRGEWLYSPPTVNAYYFPPLNEIVFFAGILQPPFFIAGADDAINYGSIGVVIGHEIIHGFDDEGRKFDKDGNLKEWWTAEDERNFLERAGCVEKQFSGYEVEKGVAVNGKLVLGESLADLGGLNLSYEALQKSLAGKPRPTDIDGYTPEQRFFLGYAQIWRSNARPEFLRLLVATDPHPPSRFRVNGPLSNMPAFAGAFGCKSGDAMIRTEACRVW